jgi:general secretion pathway protein M
MKNWYLSLAPRERWLVTGAAVFIAVVIFYLALVEPLIERRAMLERGIVAQRELAAWMRGIAGDGDTAAPVATPDSGGSLFAVVDRSVRGTLLAGAVQRVQPEGSGSVRVWLDGANFDELVRWIAVLDRQHGIGVTALAVERGAASGIVNARLTLERGR